MRARPARLRWCCERACSAQWQNIAEIVLFVICLSAWRNFSCFSCISPTRLFQRSKERAMSAESIRCAPSHMSVSHRNRKLHMQRGCLAYLVKHRHGGPSYSDAKSVKGSIRGSGGWTCAATPCLPPPTLAIVAAPPTRLHSMRARLSAVTHNTALRRAAHELGGKLPQQDVPARKIREIALAVFCRRPLSCRK